MKENSLKDQKIDRLEKIKDLFTELEAKNNAEWTSGFSSYIAYDYYYTNLAKHLDKEVSGK